MENKFFESIDYVLTDVKKKVIINYLSALMMWCKQRITTPLLMRNRRITDGLSTSRQTRRISLATLH